MSGPKPGHSGMVLKELVKSKPKLKAHALQRWAACLACDWAGLPSVSQVVEMAAGSAEVDARAIGD